MTMTTMPLDEQPAKTPTIIATTITHWYADDSPVVLSRQPVTRLEIAALNVVAARIRGHEDEWPLISLLRKLDPESPILAQMDAIARQAGWAQAGSAEVLPGWERPDDPNTNLTLP